MEILKKEIHNKEKYFSILIEDKNEDIKFWIDCSLIDDYGHNDDNGDFMDWDFNQYIFSNYSDEDEKQKAYQDDVKNIDTINEYIYEQEQDLVEWYKSSRGGNNEK